MPSPADVARAREARLAQERNDRREAEEREHSANYHYMYDTECEHHCCCCCPALALGVHI